MKSLAKLQAECVQLRISAKTNGRPKKESFIAALREYHWQKDHPSEPLPRQVMPMLLSNWVNPPEEQAEKIEKDFCQWIVQPKLDGIRVLIHIEDGRVRITSRYVSETTYRLSEFQDNVPHLTNGLAKQTGTILDGELVCPVAKIDTGNTTTATSLQATVAILSTRADNARKLQQQHEAKLKFHAFDVVRFRETDVTKRTLIERQEFLVKAIETIDNGHFEIVPSFVVGKADVHRRIIEAGGEGTVWKKADQPYEPGRRVKHWIKRKREVAVEAFVSGFKLGKPGNGHAHLVGALEFSIRQGNGCPQPVAWVSNFTDSDRKAMTKYESSGKVRLNLDYFGKRAVIVGQDESAKSKRLCHARIASWRD